MKSGKAHSVPAGLVLSLGVNIAITATAIAIIAVMLKQNRILWDRTGYWIMTTLFIASFSGAKTAINSIKTQKYIVALMSGILYWFFLLSLTAILFGGHYSSVLETAALIISGSLTAALIHHPQKYTVTPKRRYSHC